MPKTSFEYDKLGRVTKKVTPAGTVYYGYDKSGKKTWLMDPDFNQTYYTYDSAGRLTSVELDGARTATFHYDGSGRVVKKLLPNNRVMSYYTYDGAGRLQQLENRGSSGTLITYYHYTRDANGRPTRIRHEGGNTYLTYDELGRLARDQRVGTNSYDNSYEYDAASNRTRKTDNLGGDSVFYYPNELNQITKAVDEATGITTYFDYDDAQRMLSSRAAGLQSAYFTYDQRHQVTRIDFAKPASPDSTREFAYNGLGERFFVKDGAGAFNQTYWAYDGAKLIREGKADGTTARLYRHNDSVLDPMGSLIEVHSAITSEVTTRQGQCG